MPGLISLCKCLLGAWYPQVLAEHAGLASISRRISLAKQPRHLPQPSVLTLLRSDVKLWIPLSSYRRRAELSVPDQTGQLHLLSCLLQRAQSSSVASTDALLAFQPSPRDPDSPFAATQERQAKRAKLKQEAASAYISADGSSSSLEAGKQARARCKRSGLSWCGAQG